VIKINNCISIKEASTWATNYLNKPVTPSNITYLVQYAKIRKYVDNQRKIIVNKDELKRYYDDIVIKKQNAWKKYLGNDLNWALSFDHLREADTTKHVHRLHPYKGKFIPQLVEYFLDNHINTFKKQIFFKKGDIILDPFMGSGTTLIQASELGMHSIGIDISEFNCLLSKVKLDNYDIKRLSNKLQEALLRTAQFSERTFDDDYDLQLKEKLYEFNQKHFPNPEFKHKVSKGKISEEKYAQERFLEFLKKNEKFLTNNGTKNKINLASQEKMSSFLNTWFSKRIQQELYFYLKLINTINDKQIRNIMKIVLSRTARSCRATTHSDLATLKEPQRGPYYCRKHKKICTPINSILKHLRRNTYDTLTRLNDFSKLKKKTQQTVLSDDSRTINILEQVKNQNPALYKILKNNKIAGIFTSPPYVGQIDYHEQHAYAYELFKINRRDKQEIGPLYKGRGAEARKEYIEGISQVLTNISKFVKDDGHFFIVANDKFNLYPIIAEKSGLKIVNKFKRPVLNRTERDRQPYAEIIFHMQKKN